MERWDTFEIVWATISWNDGPYTSQFIIDKERQDNEDSA